AELAAGLWSGVGAELDLGAAPDEATLAALGAVPGVRSAQVHGAGARLVLDEREVLPGVVAVAVGRGLPVYAAAGRTPTLRDVCFAIERRIAEEEEGALGTDACTGTLAPDEPTTDEAGDAPTRTEAR